MGNRALANWNGAEMPLEDVKVSVLDRAFLFGDAVYEVIRIYHGHLFHLQDHLDRLAKSMGSLRIVGVDASVVGERLEQTLDHSNVLDGLAYVQVTRGQAPRRHSYPDHATANVLVYVDQFDDPYAQGRLKGVSAVTHPDIRWARNDIKTTSLAANCMAAQYAFERGAADVLFIGSDGFVTEGSHTSIFAVRGRTILVSPGSSKVLPGITKEQVLELARLRAIPVSEERIKQSEIHALDELFLAGTPEEILAIVRVDGSAIGEGVPGSVVTELQDEFRRSIERWLISCT